MEASHAAAPPPAAAPAPPPPAAPPAAAPAAPAPAPAPSLHPTVADVVAATHVGAKRRRAGLAPPPPASLVPAPDPVPAPAPAPASAPAPKKSRPKVSSRGPRGASSKVAGSSPARKKLAARKKPAAPPAAVAEPLPSVHEVFEEMATPSSFMDLLQDAEVDLGAPPLEPLRVGDDLEEDEEDEGDDEEEVAEIGEEAFTAASRPHTRSTNYTEAEDILLVRAWAVVGMDATTGTDQTGKRYWQRIEDNYCRIKPKNSGFSSHTYWSLQGRWELMKPACARWSAAMDQVRDAPPSGTVESDYEKIAGTRYKEMAASKGKPFPFKHAWAILQTFDK
ncbi:putative methionyl-tRNA synthetase [Hordeum vulgare]|nr:putative methionyl-tRNA synthetase [Hordeum vulgare]